MQDQNDGGISEASTGFLPSITQTIDPNRSPAVIEPSGSLSLIADESATGPSGRISAFHTSPLESQNPTTILSPSKTAICPRPDNFNELEIKDTLRNVRSAIQSAISRRVLSSNEIMIFFLHWLWGIEDARKCAEVFGLDSRQGWLQWLENNPSKSHT